MAFFFAVPAEKRVPWPEGVLVSRSWSWETRRQGTHAAERRILLDARTFIKLAKQDIEHMSRISIDILDQRLEHLYAQSMMMISDKNGQLNKLVADGLK